MSQLNLAAADVVLRQAVPGMTPAAQLVVLWDGETRHAGAYGWLDLATHQQPVSRQTLFDLASLSKLFVTIAFMTLVEQGRVGLDDYVGGVLSELNGRRPIAPYEDPLTPGRMVRLSEEAEVDVGAITFRHLLTHTSGLPAWRPLFRQPNPAAARAMALATPCAYPTAERVVYSDIGLILLGLAVEQLTGMPLDQAVAQRVTGPAGLASARYLPAGDVPAPPIAPTERCAWRNRRLTGEVHDENAAGLGGVAGHAGIFATASDVARLGQLMLDGGGPLLSPATVADMVREQARSGDTRRGLGFALWSPDPEASGHPFGPGAFGHTGFTGTSVWVDPRRRLVVALLTNDVFYGRAGRGIASLRVAVHQAIVEAVDAIERKEERA